MKRIYRAASLTEAHLLKGLLERHGIPVRLMGEGLAGALGELPLEVAEVELQVPPGFAALARELLDEYEQRPTGEGPAAPPWVCRDCGETNPAYFEVCWNCSPAAADTAAHDPGGDDNDQ